MLSTRKPLRVAVVGGGVTGLTAAWQIQRLGHRVTVLEAGARAGGVVGAQRLGAWLQELGPNSLLEGSPEIAAFVDDVGLAPRRLYAAPAAKQRYLVRGGCPVALPTSPGAFLRTPLFSAGAKLRLLLEPFRRRAPADADESLADFVRRRLGREFLDYAINPFVAGVYAGDPESLSVRHAFPRLHALEQEHGSLLLGALRWRNSSGGPKGRIFSFPEGLGEIPRALQARLLDPVRLRTRVTALRRAGAGWRLTLDQRGTAEEAEFDLVVCALPADALAALDFPELAADGGLRLLAEIPHPPVASVFTGHRREDVTHPLDGFGLLVPAVEGGRILGTLFSSTLFPGRAPEGHVALTTFVGGTRQPELTALDDAALATLVCEELGRLLGVSGTPAIVRVQRWPRAIPQYAPGHERFLTAIRQLEAAAPGVFVGGNCRDGISLPNCITAGHRLAAAV
ncbi:MAG: protoporphyrinogen oxidase, partial [Verrucomicrobia bacterium]|nr:protoporphyrinogen oxidase [Verrucomicrobiota bacterium]